MSNLVESLKKCDDAIFGIRAKIGADLRKVYFITRTWSGREIGDGEYEDKEEEILPTPGIKQLAHDLRIKEGGEIKSGDIIIYHVSKSSHRYPNESDIDAISGDRKIERLYRIGKEIYRVISIVERHLSWDIQVRRISDQRK